MASAIDWKEFVAWQGVSKLLETVFVVYVSPHFFFFFHVMITFFFQLHTLCFLFWLIKVTSRYSVNPLIYVIVIIILRITFLCSWYCVVWFLHICLSCLSYKLNSWISRRGWSSSEIEDILSFYPLSHHHVPPSACPEWCTSGCIMHERALS